MPLRHLASGRRSPNRHAILVGISAAMVLGLLTVTARTALDAGSKRQEPLVLQRRSARSAAPQPALPPPAERNSASPEVAAGGASSGGTTVAGLPQPTPLVLIPIPGEVTIRQTPARELSPPAIASIRLAVGTAGGRAMPQWLEEEWTVGALIVEQADGQARRYVELPSLAAHCDAEVVDGADRVLVRFHFARKLPPQTDLSAPMVAVSCATAEISIQAGSHYDLCFDPARPAIDQLETVVKGEESGWASPHRD